MTAVPPPSTGRIVEINGAVVRAQCDGPIALGEVILVGEERLLGEAIALTADRTTLQVYEDTTGLRAGAPVTGTGAPLSVDLGPGLLGSVFDGIQRPLDRLAAAHGDFLPRGQQLEPLSRERVWDFRPVVVRGTAVAGGTEIGVIPETAALDHRVLIPPRVHGTLDWIADAGAYRHDDVIARVHTADGVADVRMLQQWHVRIPRPFRRRLPLATPLLTGQRVLDTFFPLARGASAGMPGGFGTGKTVLQHQLCRWAEADVIVFVGCGERGNEMTEMLWKLPELVDPRTGRPLAERTVLIANTSNMPVPAREASIYTAVTIAEFYRDMGYHVLLLADSTSRWAEALREISGRLEEIPAEEGYPPYLSSRLASFYERAGRVVSCGGREGSVTIISAISPPGGDFTEPVTRHTQRFTGCFWTLDKALADARSFPAISVEASYSTIASDVAAWWADQISAQWPGQRQAALELLEEGGRIRTTARLIGEASLPDRHRLVLRAMELLEEGFLRQLADDPIDASCTPARQARLLDLLLSFYREGRTALDAGAALGDVLGLPVLAALARAKSTCGNDDLAPLASLEQEIHRQFAALRGATV